MLSPAELLQRRLDCVAENVLADRAAPPFLRLAAWKHYYRGDSDDLNTIVSEAFAPERTGLAGATVLRGLP